MSNKDNIKKPAALSPKDSKKTSAKGPAATPADKDKPAGPKSRGPIVFLAVVVVLALAGLAVWAYLPDGPASGFNQRVWWLLQQKPVQEEIKLTSDEIEKITKIDEDRNRPWSKHEMQTLSENEKENRQQQRNRSAVKTLAGVLSKEQMTRVRQIYLQWRDKRTWADEDIAIDLKLTPQQKKEIAALQTQYQKERRDMFRKGGGGNREEAPKKMEEMRKANEEQLMGLLTTVQQNKWDAMLGDRFEALNQLPRDFGGGGGGPPGGFGGPPGGFGGPPGGFGGGLP